MIKQTIGVLCMMAAACGHAQIGVSIPATTPASPSRQIQVVDSAPLLPDVAVRDAAGQRLDTAGLALDRNWVLVVLDAELPSAEAFLSALSMKQQEPLDERTTILLVGSAAAVERFGPKQRQLAGARWIYAEDAAVIGRLQVAAVPSMMGIRADRTVAWTFSGVRNRPELIGSTIRGWLGLNPAVNPAR